MKGQVTEKGKDICNTRLEINFSKFTKKRQKTQFKNVQKLEQALKKVRIFSNGHKHMKMYSIT